MVSVPPDAFIDDEDLQTLLSWDVSQDTRSER